MPKTAIEARNCGQPTCNNTTKHPSGRCHVHRTPAPAPSQDAAQGRGRDGWWNRSLSKNHADALPFDLPKREGPPPDIRFGHANDAVLPPDKVDLSRLEHLRGRDIVTVDLDGTIFGRELCHPLPRHHPGLFDGDDDCDHVRQDIVDDIRRRCEETGAVPVVLSWRAGHHEASKKWLDTIGFDHHAMFIPGAPDDVAGLELEFDKSGHVDHQASRKRYGGGQVAFKQATAEVLQRELGCRIVGAYDDNPKVIDGLNAAGASGGVAVHVPGRDKRCAGCSQPFDPVNLRPSTRDPSRCGECVWPEPSVTKESWPARPSWMPAPPPPTDPLAGLSRPGWMPDPAHAARIATVASPLRG